MSFVFHSEHEVRCKQAAQQKERYKMNSLLKRIIASVSAVSLIVPAFAMTDVQKVNAGQMLGETSFDYKILPWHTVEASPAKQNFEITPEGEFHVMILWGQGAEKEKWDLQVRHRNLNFKAGHTYTVSFRAKGKREGMELCSYISNIRGDEEYCVLFGDKKEMGNGPHMGGQWGKALRLTTDWQEVTGTFTPTKDLEACEWSFQYARGTQYEGNAESGDEIWFDDMSLVDESADDFWPVERYGAVSRSYSNLRNNYISVNQVGYFPDRRKIAVLSDNKGDFMHGAETISLSEAAAFEVIDAKNGKTVYTGKSTLPEKDADSGDTVCKLDFSEFIEPGTYYIKAGDYRSAEFKIGNDIYSEKDHDLLTNAVNYFYQNRSGIDIEEKYISSADKSYLAHPGSHKTDTASVQKIWKNEYASKDEPATTYASSKITASGGWYDSGDHTKCMVNGGMAVWTLQNMYDIAVTADESQKFEDASGAVVVPETGNKIPDILDEAAYELDWMAEMKVAEDEPAWCETAAGLYYHKLQDHKWTGLAVRPWDYETEWGTTRIVKPPTFAATLNYAACAAQAARLWKPYDSAKAEKYLASAIDAYRAYQKWYYEADATRVTHPDYKCDSPKEEINEVSLYAPLWQSKGGGAYGDFYVADDAYLAACELFISAKEMENEYADEALKELEKYDNAYEITTKVYDNDNNMSDLTVFDHEHTGAAGTLSLALHDELLRDVKREKLNKSLKEAADKLLETEEKQGYGLPYAYEVSPYYDSFGDPTIRIFGYKFESNLKVLNNAAVLAYAYEKTGDSRYIDGVSSAMDYLLGTNPLAFSYITGYGEYRVHNPYHRFWANELDKSLPSAPDGVISSGPNSGLEDTYVRLLGFVPGKTGNFPQRCYADSVEAWSVNETSLELNASLAWVTSFLQLKHPYTPEDPKNTPEPTESPESTAANSTDPTPTSEPTACIGPVIGDIDCDGKIDITDLTELAIALVDRVDLKGQANKNADIDKDGEVTLADLARLRQYLSKKIDKL